MEKYEHLRLPLFESNVDRRKRSAGGGFKLLSGRDKAQFSQKSLEQVNSLSNNFSETKSKFSGKIDPKLIFEIEINQSVSVNDFEKTLLGMGLRVLSVADGKKGYWVVFSQNEHLEDFRKKLTTYGSKDGHNYDFFHAIESIRDIPVERKIGEQLTKQPLTDTVDFIDIELWKIEDSRENETFIQQLKVTYPDYRQFRITDQLITHSFVLLRVKLTKPVFDEIIQLKEIARADRPSVVQFNPFEVIKPKVEDIKFSAPKEDATGILIIDSGIVANHPMLEKCVGGEENFQAGEQELQDTVGHGMAVAGCAVYGDVEFCLENKNFTPSNWLFSAKVMYAETNYKGERIAVVYDPDSLIEHQFKKAVESFLSNSSYHIKVVNISLGNSNEVWRKHYSRQLLLAALIDELAFTFPHVVFIVSAGNQSPLIYNSIAEITENYPNYLVKNEDFKIINPATAALALTVGSIAHEVRIEKERDGAEFIKKPIAQKDQPSPFTRTGFGINGMVKPELVEYGGNLILSGQYGRIVEDKGGKLALLNNKAVDNIIQFNSGTSFAAPKVAHLAGRIANHFPDKSANFIKNMLLASAIYPFEPNKFYGTKNDGETHLSVCGYGLSQYERALYSFSNRAVLWDEGKIGLDQIKVYSLQLPELFFTTTGKKAITVTLTFTPKTRPTRGDSYLGNCMEFHLFHTISPDIIKEKYGIIKDEKSEIVPPDLEKFEIDDFFPRANTRKAGCHQKAWKQYKREPKDRPQSPISLVLINRNKWLIDTEIMQDYCISVTFDHEKDIELYNALKTKVQTRTKIR